MSYIVSITVKGQATIPKELREKYEMKDKAIVVAEEKTRNLKAYGIKVIPLVDDTLWKLAAKIKSNHPMSIANSFAVATAQFTDSKLVIGYDQEFNKLPIETLRIGSE